MPRKILKSNNALLLPKKKTDKSAFFKFLNLNFIGSDLPFWKTS
jgi:hypothetical protein